MLHDGGVATFDEVLLRVRATIFYEERVIDECTSDGRFEHGETDRANATTDNCQKEQIENQKKQTENQNEQMENQEWRFLKQLERQESLHKAQMEAFLSAVDKTNTVASTSLQGATPSFVQFDPSSELLDRLLGEITYVCQRSLFNYV